MLSINLYVSRVFPFSKVSHCFPTVTLQALEERLEKDLKTRQKMTAEEDGPAAGGQSQGPIVLQEDSSRTSYQPQLKILKRPTGSDADAGDAGKSTKQDSVAKTKSLAEREAEYAAARMRIMGSATSSYPDEGPSKQAVSLAKSSTKLDGESTQSKGKR